MRERKIGRLAECLRKGMNIRMKKIYGGICSESMYIRFETGESMPDFQTLTCLLSRLGKSINKIYMIMSYEDYEMYCLQEEVETLIAEGAFIRAEDVLRMYKKKNKAEMPCHRQYVLKMKSIMLLQQRRYAEAIDIIEEAIRTTVPQFKILEMESCLFSIEEWMLILLLFTCKLQLKECGVEQKCENIISLLESNVMDSEMKIELWSRASLLFADSFMQAGRVQEAKEMCFGVLDFLEQEASLFLVPQILKKLMDIVKEQGEIEEEREIRRVYNIFCWIYKMVGRQYELDIDVWGAGKQAKVYLLAETIRGERKQNKMTKNTLAERAELDVRTLARIEAGVHFPKTKTFEKLMKAVRCEYYIHRTCLVTENFRVLEIQREISEALMRQNYVQARKCLDILAKSISLEYRENRQYVFFTQNIIEIQEGKTEIKEAIDLCVRSFETTRPFDEKTFEEVVLGVQETLIVNYIAKLYYKLGEEKRAIQLLESALAGFDSSYVDQRYHSKEISLLLESLALYCETSNNFDKALRYCKRGIELEIICRKGGLLGSFLMQQTYIKERMGMHREQCMREYCMIYHLLILMKMEQNASTLERYYRLQYNEDITKNAF